MPKSKFTIEQRKIFNLIRKANSLMKKAIKPIGKELLKQAKASVPVDSGALKKSLAEKEVAKSGKKAGIVIGARVNFEYEKDNVIKYPKEYVKQVDEATGFLSDLMTPNVLERVKTEAGNAIKGAIK